MYLTLKQYCIIQPSKNLGKYTSKLDFHCPQAFFIVIREHCFVGKDSQVWLNFIAKRVFDLYLGTFKAGSQLTFIELLIFSTANLTTARLH